MSDKKVGDLTIEELKEIIREVIEEMDKTPDKTPFPYDIPDVDKPKKYDTPIIAFYMISSDKDNSGAWTDMKITYSDNVDGWSAETDLTKKKTKGSK